MTSCVETAVDSRVCWELEPRIVTTHNAAPAACATLWRRPGDFCGVSDAPHRLCLGLRSLLERLSTMQLVSLG